MVRTPKKEKKPIPKTADKKHTPDPSEKSSVEPANRPKGLMVVGIGASAGGLAALRSFFEALPSDTGMAFVVVTHLHPEHESHMAELLQKYTKMPAEQVMTRVKVEPDHVYVISPNRSIMMADSHLETAEFDEPHGRRTPIDHFFRSLASGHSESMAVILSGGGTDGSVGLKNIKEQGGLILVQHPEDAEYDSMPRAAIGTGLADVVLPAGQLAEKLAEYVKHQPRLPHDAGELTDQETETLHRILAQVHARTGHDFNQYKRSTILRRVERRMQLNGFTTLEAYLDFLRHNANEAIAMFNDILIGVTNFFRDRESWQALAEKVVPALFDKFEKKEGEDGIRVWSIGCATGEEAYGLAILLFEQAARLEIRPRFQVFASDLDERSIAQAREGLYPAAIEADVSSGRLERFFTREGEYYRVKREVRDAVLFTNHNVLRDPPFSRQDLIACRNVLIYLQREIQENVFDIFHYALNPGGYIFLGSSESVEQLPDLFNVVDKTHRIYQGRPWTGDRPHMPSLPLTLRRARTSTEQYGVTRPHLKRFLDEEAPAEEHRRALETYAPPSILINEKSVILHVSETAGRYLLQPKGPITGDLLKLARPELQLELRTTIFRAFEKDRATLSRPVFVQFNGHPRRVTLAVRPRPEAAGRGGGQERQALVVFMEDELEDVLETPDVDTHHPRNEAERDQVIAQLESEVQRLREQLQVTIEEYDSSNEEMKAANEELQSINKEYRSATEELETSKEELQSVNEELQTVNSDMRNKLEEISRAHEELENLLGATEIGTLFLDRELRIQRFTAGLNQLINLMPGDRGRPIGHLTHKLRYDQFMEDAEQVLRQLVHVERELQTENDDWYLLRFRPFRTTEDRIVGVVITFIDITKLKKAEQDILHAKETLEERVEERTSELNEATRKMSLARDLFYALFDANPIPTALTRLEDDAFLNVNAEFLTYFGFQREEVIGHSAEEFNLGLGMGTTSRAAFIAQIRQAGRISDIETEIQHPSGGERYILASTQYIDLDDTEAIISTFIDITDRVEAERRVHALAADLTEAEQQERHRISQVLHDDLQQRLFAIKAELAALHQRMDEQGPEALQTTLSELDETLAETIALTRSLSVEISPIVLQGEGLGEAVTWLGAQMQKLYGLNVTVEADSVRTDFEKSLRVILFQSVRELLFNVVKHAETMRATVTMEKADGRVRITVSDGGKGFNAQAVLNDPGTAHSLASLHQRLELMSCRMQVESQPGAGTRVSIDCPPPGD